MKKSLLAIALGLAVMPLTFAQPANPPAKQTSKKGKKSAKKGKNPKKTEGAAAGQSK
jgi:hypothetical protein